jgi:hypothetical protein
MARVRGGGGAADDLLKLLLGMWGDDAAKAGAKAAKKAKAPAKAPAKKAAKAPAKKASKAPAKKQPPRKSAGPVRRAEDAPSVGWMSQQAPTTKGPRGNPERPRKTREQWLESQANKRLRREGNTPPRSPERDARVGEAPNIPRVPKRSKSKPRGRRSDYEADKSRAEIAEDRRRFRGTRPAPSRKPKGGGKK